jgi:hypothetical protein
MLPNKKTISYTDVILKLGIHNVAYVAWYRFSIRSGMRKRFFPQRDFGESGHFFYPVESRTDYPEDWKSNLFNDTGKIVHGKLRYYGRHWKHVGNPPDWFLNPFNEVRYPDPDRHWTALKDFHPKAGDIKNIWEASRFEGVVTLARAYAISGNAVYLDTINQWLGDWCRKNPVNTGPNWKCGQETSIRIFNLLQAALILNQWEHPSPALQEFVYHHLERIQANIRYAVAQDNNHGTSEAAALFIGGHWLARTYAAGPLNGTQKSWNVKAQECKSSSFCSDKEEKSKHNPRQFLSQPSKWIQFARVGRRWLENRMNKLVEPDGSFSQHSVTYHRLLLDTLIFVEFRRKKLEADPFSDLFYERIRAAIQWLETFTDSQSGNAPNLGANDGAMLLNTHGCDYRDFRPTLQTASVLFQQKKYFGPGIWDEPLHWFGLNKQNVPRAGLEKTDRIFPGGYVIMAGKTSWGMIRFPMYRFRPSHNDVFHFDLWCNGENICRDAGSYSYNSGNDEDDSWFKSVKAHNTVSFDDHEQMPRLGRFMLGHWIKPEYVGPIENLNYGGHRWSGAYKDFRGNRHQRTVEWHENTWTIKDLLSGPFKNAEIRFHLMSGPYRIEAYRAIAPWGTVEVEPFDCQISMTSEFESLYYWEKQPVNLLVVRVEKDCGTITTRFRVRG